LTFIKGIIEYTRQGSQKRAELFLEMAKRIEQNKVFNEISSLLEDDDTNLKEIPYHDKVNFLGLFEAIAMMMNSRLIERELVHYWFAYYAIRCWESENFWKVGEADNCMIDKDSIYWVLFKDFVEEMRKIEKRMESACERLDKGELTYDQFKRLVIAKLRV
jgi:hypothetical protein